MPKLVLFFILFLLACKNTPPSQKILECPNCNIVVIVIDTLRADHLPFYGYNRNTAPFLTELANKSIVFERAFSSSSWTAPATATIFTSLVSARHGVITGFAATDELIKSGAPIELNKIPTKLKTMGELMQQAGFDTIGVADNLNIGSEMGFDRGFNKFKKFYYEGAENTNKQVIEFLGEAPKSPYFLYIHYMDPHRPYHKREPFFSECKSTIIPTQKTKIICAYDSEIKYADSQIQILFEKYQWLKNSIVFLTADHGEEFWDHGLIGHGKTLYTESIHVPFLIYHPFWKAKRIDANVGTIDILPTLAGLLDIKRLPEWQGYNLITSIKTGVFDNDRIVFSERLRNPHSKKKWWKRAVVKNDWHYIQTEEPNIIKNKELFDIKTDFKELNNLAEQNAPMCVEFAATIKDEPLPDFNDKTYSTKSEVDKKMYEQLRSLGYIN